MLILYPDPFHEADPGGGNETDLHNTANKTSLRPILYITCGETENVRLSNFSVMTGSPNSNSGTVSVDPCIQIKMRILQTKMIGMV